MSLLFDNDFLNFTGMDMMQNDPEATKSQSPQPHQEEFLSKHTKKIRELFFQALAELKKESLEQIETQTIKEVVEATPTSFRLSEDSEKQRHKAKVVAEIRRSFKLPQEYYTVHDVDLDKLPVPDHLFEQMKPDAEYERRFTFSERLEGWKLQRKQRANGKFDTYFHHEISDEPFRSVVEVSNFILYAICPRHLQKLPKGIPKDDSPGTKSVKRVRSTIQSNAGGEEIHSAPVISEGARAVKEFLEAAYNNLLNFHSEQDFPESLNEDDEAKEDTQVLSVSENNQKPKENTGLLLLSYSKKNEPKEDIVMLLSDSEDNYQPEEDKGNLSDASQGTVEVEESMDREFDEIINSFVNTVMTQENKRKRTGESREEDKSLGRPSPFSTSERSRKWKKGIAPTPNLVATTPVAGQSTRAPFLDTVSAVNVEVHNNILPVPAANPGEGEGAVPAATLGTFADVHNNILPVPEPNQAANPDKEKGAAAVAALGSCADMHNNALPVPAANPGGEESASVASTLGSLDDIFDPLEHFETLPEAYYNPNEYDLANCLVRLKNNGEDHLLD